MVLFFVFLFPFFPSILPWVSEGIIDCIASTCECHEESKQQTPSMYCYTPMGKPSDPKDTSLLIAHAIVSPTWEHCNRKTRPGRHLQESLPAPLPFLSHRSHISDIIRLFAIVIMRASVGNRSSNDSTFREQRHVSLRVIS
ncbi:hypothetical protein BX600DRAFT_450190 [Xylariales sp. PMI_506]|nr:hypothetical protein BX600DRAFT_450190 [Xylariales sp. PMI_506]